MIAALSYAGGPEAALKALDSIRDEPKMQQYLPFFATEADLYRRVGEREQAAAAYYRAIELAETTAQREFFAKRQREL